MNDLSVDELKKLEVLVNQTLLADRGPSEYVFVIGGQSLLEAQAIVTLVRAATWLIEIALERQEQAESLKTRVTGLFHGHVALDWILDECGYPPTAIVTGSRLGEPDIPIEELTIYHDGSRSAADSAERYRELRQELLHKMESGPMTAEQALQAANVIRYLESERAAWKRGYDEKAAELHRVLSELVTERRKTETLTDRDVRAIVAAQAPALVHLSAEQRVELVAAAEQLAELMLAAREERKGSV